MITITNKYGEVIAIITEDEIVSKDGYSVIMGEAQYQDTPSGKVIVKEQERITS